MMCFSSPINLSPHILESHSPIETFQKITFLHRRYLLKCSFTLFKTQEVRDLEKYFSFGGNRNNLRNEYHQSSLYRQSSPFYRPTWPNLRLSRQWTANQYQPHVPKLRHSPNHY